MSGRILTSAQAINEALAVMGERDKSVMLFGEGIDDKAAFYGTTENLRPIYGDDRLIEMPISENAMMGVAIGAAISGKRPVIQFHRVEFALLAMEQIINNAAKMHYTSNGQHTCPLVIRMIVGRGWGQGPSHSQSLESMFAYIPGLKVLMPTFPAEYKGMLIAAIEDNNPVVIIEHRWTHYLKEYVPEGYYTRNITSPQLLRCGPQITIVSTAYATVEANAACDALADAGILVDHFDLRVLRPLAPSAILASVQKTGRLLVVDTGYKTFGTSAEIAAQVAEHCTAILFVSRLGIPDHPIPSSRGYIPGIYPGAQAIANEVCRSINHAPIAVKSSDTPIDIPDPSYQGSF